MQHVYHLAGRSYVPDSWASPAEFIEVNVLCTLRVLEFCRVRGASLTFASAYVYGRPDRVPVAESAPARPASPYAHSKLIAEDLCRLYAERYAVPVGIARMFNVYGPGQDARFLIPTVIEQVRRGAEIRMRDLSPRRDFVYVDDAADALARLAAKRPACAIFNVASGTSVSIGDIIARIQSIAGTSKPVRCDDEQRPEEIPDSAGDASAALAELGWRAATPLDEGLRRTLGAA